MNIKKIAIAVSTLFCTASVFAGNVLPHAGDSKMASQSWVTGKIATATSTGSTASQAYTNAAVATATVENHTYTDTTVAAATAAATYQVGQLALGGYIFWVDPKGQHGLVASLVDNGTNLPWSNTYTATGASASGSYAGKANTTVMMAKLFDGTTNTLTNFAAGVCFIYNSGGSASYSDWYLPSIGEMETLGQSIIDRPPPVEFQVLTGDYWTSDEDLGGTTNAFFLATPYTNGFESNYPKTTGRASERCIRSF